jgi:aminoglycoside/choline kinase family phosphotransferase
MDAPPDKEDVAPFLKVAALLAGCGVHVPHIHAADSARGLVLLEDLGSDPYLTQLQAGDDADLLYGDALDALLRIQLRGREARARAAALRSRGTLEREMALMPQWFCERHLQLALDDADRGVLAESFEFPDRGGAAQPLVLVHRDYHSRNLMRLPSRNPGVIDFRTRSPARSATTWCRCSRIATSTGRAHGWSSGSALSRAPASPAALAGSSEREFLRWFDLIGLQRHIKVLGIFARLWYRDGKSGYLPDLPRTLEYVLDGARRFPELRGFAQWLQRRVCRVRRRERAGAGGTAP